MKSRLQLSSFVATLMPFHVFIAFAIFSMPGGLLDAAIGRGKALLPGLGRGTLAVGVPALKNPTPHRRSRSGTRKVCRRS